MPVSAGQSKETATKTNDLLYLSDSRTSVDYYSYPKAKHVGTLTNLYDPGGLCSDASGNVYVLSGTEVMEFAHGGTQPIQTLAEGNAPQDCAVDPNTGDLALANSYASVSIYRRGKGKQHVYHYSYPSYKVAFFNCTYDNASNLYVDAEFSPTQTTGNYGFSVLELPKGSRTLRGVWNPEGGNLNGFPGGLQWDGKQLAVGDGNSIPSRVYLKDGSVITLNGSSYIDQFWIQGDRIIASDGYNTFYWHYPAGGDPIKTIVAGATAATVSEGASKR